MSVLVPLNEQGVLGNWDPLCTCINQAFTAQNMTIHWDGFDQADSMPPTASVPLTQTTVTQNNETGELQLLPVSVALPENPRNVLRGMSMVMEIPFLQQASELADQHLQMSAASLAQSFRDVANQFPDVQEHEEVRVKVTQVSDLTTQLWMASFKFHFVEPSSSTTITD